MQSLIISANQRKTSYLFTRGYSAFFYFKSPDGGLSAREELECLRLKRDSIFY